MADSLSFPGGKKMPTGCATSVLVVDDHSDTAKLLAKSLRRRGLEVEAAESGEEALRLLGRIKPTVVIMDEMMPGLTGLQVVRLMRDKSEFRSTKIIFYSASYDYQKQREAHTLGVIAWLVKGVARLDDLTSAVQALCRQGSAGEPNN